jgi:hypothetical protein
MKETDDAVAEGPFTLQNTGQEGVLQARIKDGQVAMANDAMNVSNVGFC